MVFSPKFEDGEVFVHSCIKYRFKRNLTCLDCCFLYRDENECIAPSDFPYCYDGCFVIVTDSTSNE